MSCFRNIKTCSVVWSLANNHICSSQTYGAQANTCWSFPKPQSSLPGSISKGRWFMIWILKRNSSLKTKGSMYLHQNWTKSLWESRSRTTPPQNKPGFRWRLSPHPVQHQLKLDQATSCKTLNQPCRKAEERLSDLGISVTFCGGRKQKRKSWHLLWDA